MRTLLRLFFEQDMSVFDILRIVIAANAGHAASDTYGWGFGLLAILVVIYGTGWISRRATEKWGRA